MSYIEALISVIIPVYKVEKYLEKCIQSVVNQKLYHRFLWELNRFPEGKIYEDIAIMHEIVRAAERIVMVNEPLYHYYHRANSIATAHFSEALFDYPEHTRRNIVDITNTYPQMHEHTVWAHMMAVSRVLKNWHVQIGKYLENIENSMLPMSVR